MVRSALRRPPVWLIVAMTALLSAVLTLGLDRGIQALRTQVPATPTPGQSQPVVVVIETPEPALAPSVLPEDETERQLVELQQQSAQQRGFMFVLKAERQLAAALEAFDSNDAARADSELDAAHVSLDEAFQMLPEDLKPQLDKERLEIGRIRADLEVNPRGLDEDVRQMRVRLLSLIGPRPQ